MKNYVLVNILLKWSDMSREKIPIILSLYEAGALPGCAVAIHQRYRSVDVFLCCIAHRHSAQVPEAEAFALLTVRLPTREDLIRGRLLEDVAKLKF
jgi:hypothetical protein